MAEGSLLAWGVVEFDCAGDGSDWRLLLVAIRERSLSAREGASSPMSRGELAAAMKRSSPCSPSTLDVSWPLRAACVSSDWLRMPEPYAEEPSTELAMCLEARVEFCRERVGVCM